MANSNMNKAQMAVAAYGEELAKNGVSIELQAGKNPKQCTRVIFRKGNEVKDYSTSAFYGNDFMELLAEVKRTAFKMAECSMASAMVEPTHDETYQEERNQLRTYVKQSYQFGKDSLAKILFDAIDFDCGYAKEFVEGLAGVNFEKQSAILFRGRYVTPCMLEIVIDEYMKYHNIKGFEVKEILNKFFNTFNKVEGYKP